MDYEEHRGQISKFKMMKKKLQEEIVKHQSILQRYQKIRDKLRYESPSLREEEFDQKSAPVKGLKEKEAFNPQIYKL